MTDIEKVRLLIGDVTPALPALPYYTDAQIQAFLTMASDDIFLASAYALKSWAAAIASTVDSEKIGDYSYSKKTVANKLTVAENYLKMASEVPALGWAEMNFTDIEE